jgi:hypothetical protein
MEMQLYFGSGGGGSGSDVVDWFHPLAEFPALPLCMSPPPLLTRSVESFPEVSNFYSILMITSPQIHLCIVSPATAPPCPWPPQRLPTIVAALEVTRRLSS